MPLPSPRSTTVGLLLVAVLWSPRLNGQQPADPEDFVLALGLIDRGLHADAAERLSRFLAKQPRHPRASEAWYRLGVCRSETDDLASAVEAFRKALRSPRFELVIEGRYRLATTLQELGKYPAAKQVFGELHDALPDQTHYLAAASWFGLGECLRELGDDELALQAFAAAAARAKTNGGDGARYAFFGGYQAGFALLRLERFGEATEMFAGLAQRFGDRSEVAEIRFFEGDAAYRSGRREVAERAWRQCASIGGARADEAIYGLGWCAADAGEPARAQAQFERVLREFPNSAVAPTARLEVGRLLQAAGDNRRAVAVLEPLVAAGSSVAEDSAAGRALIGRAHEIRAAALLALGDTDGARASFERVAAEASGGGLAAANAQYGIAESLAARGEWSKALAAYERAIAASTDDDELRGDATYGAIVALHELSEFERSTTLAAGFAREFAGHPMAPQAAFAFAEGAFAAGDYGRALASYDALPPGHEQTALICYKAAWAAYLTKADRRDGAADAASRFARVAGDDRLEGTLREEALSLLALARLDAGDDAGALEAADRYRARYGDQGAHRARTERIAGRVLRSRGELDAAKLRFARAAAAETDRGTAAQLGMERADIALQQGDFTTARKLYRTAAERDDGAGARALEGLAWCAFELGDDAAALAAVARVRSHSSADDSLRAGVGDLEVALHHRASDWRRAILAADGFLHRWPQHARVPEVRYALGVALARQGDDLDRARSTLAEVSRDTAKTTTVERRVAVDYELAWVCRRLGDDVAAREAFERIVQIGTGEEASSTLVDRVGEARLELGIHALASDPQQRRQRGRKLLAAVRGRMRGDALYRLGFVARDAQRFDAAGARFDEIVALGATHPMHLEARFLAAECWILGASAGWAERALTHLEVVVDTATSSDNQRLDAARLQRARLYVGRCSVEADRPARAISALDAFLAIAERDDETPTTELARAQLWLGRAHAAREDRPRAEAALIAAAAKSDGEIGAEAQFRIGELRERARDFEGATEAFVKLSILYAQRPWVPRGLLGAVRCYSALGQQARADRFRQELTKRFPDSDAAKRAMRR